LKKRKKVNKRVLVEELLEQLQDEQVKKIHNFLIFIKPFSSSQICPAEASFIKPFVSVIYEFSY
jgi:hypothetical protein